jgi:hypothetical protein
VSFIYIQSWLLVSKKANDMPALSDLDMKGLDAGM